MTAPALAVAEDFIALAKPRVVALIALTAAAGAALALLQQAPANPAAATTAAGMAVLGIALAAAAGAAFNCMVEAAGDALMSRTRARPLPAKRLNPAQAAAFVCVCGAAGLWITALFGGALAGVLTAAAFFGYAVVYTLLLKRRTPQNIVIGGAAGAMPPLLGWVAVSQSLTYEPLLLFLIVFVWTPPHFWALALYRKDDYARANIPMLPVTHGEAFTATQILLYGALLFAVCLLPFAGGMAGALYFAAACALNARFLWLAWRLKQTLRAEYGRRLFAYSVSYLALLFAALLADAVFRALTA